MIHIDAFRILAHRISQWYQIQSNSYPKRSLVRLECHENHEPWGTFLIYPLAMTNITMENHHWNSEFTHEKWWFSIDMLVYQRVMPWVMAATKPFQAVRRRILSGMKSNPSISIGERVWDLDQLRYARRKTREAESTANGYGIAQDSCWGLGGRVKVPNLYFLQQELFSRRKDLWFGVIKRGVLDNTPM